MNFPACKRFHTFTATPFQKRFSCCSHVTSSHFWGLILQGYSLHIPQWLWKDADGKTILTATFCLVLHPAECSAKEPVAAMQASAWSYKPRKQTWWTHTPKHSTARLWNHFHFSILRKRQTCRNVNSGIRQKLKTGTESVKNRLCLHLGQNFKEPNTNCHKAENKNGTRLCEGG